MRYDDLVVEVATPAGEVFAVDNPRLLDRLREGAREGHELSVLRSERALTDCRPFSLFSIQTARQLSEELGVELGRVDSAPTRTSTWRPAKASAKTSGWGADCASARKRRSR